ncbi:MAG: hypothetical protein HDR95_06005 [Bacteroides sp.]|nr:hypothetical protein [Bacteroides sp.]
MIFNSIKIKEGNIQRLIEFSAKNNLIHSVTNSKGKTTLLRLLLYSIGYNIPNTKHIKFEDMDVESSITLDNGNHITLHRTSRDFIILQQGDEETTFLLNSQETDLHKIIFSASNSDLIANLLGLFYFDQEKGWTLLNRGVVIGSIRFNIEELIRGIADIDCSELLRVRETKKQDLLKYKQMFSVAKYQETIDVESNNFVQDSYNTRVDVSLNQCRMEQNLLKAELCRINKVLKDNRTFKNFIAEIGLLIKTPDGQTLAVTEDNIIGLNDTIDYLVAKRQIIFSQYKQLQNKLVEIERERRVEDMQLSFFEDEETISQIFDKRIANIPINEMAVKNGINRLEQEIKAINARIKDISQNTKNARYIISSIFANTKKYLSELNLNESKITERYLFTSNLKELSGAILHKTVFAFRLACLVEVEKHLGIKFPIILDSPSGKEIDPENIQAMIRILKRDFSENQIIIASIYKYDLDSVNSINIINQLIE